MSIRPPARRRIDGDDLARLARAVEAVVASDPRVLAVYLHGSAARGEAAHDLDLAVLSDGRHLRARDVDAMAARIQREGAPDGPEIDLRSLTGASPRFGASVLRDGRLLYERDRLLRRHREAEIMTRWGDFQPVWAQMRRRMLSRWASG